MAKRNIIRFIISFIFGVSIFWGFGGEAYAAATHTCSFVSSAAKLTKDTTFTGSGTYYLDEDVTLGANGNPYTIGGDVTICLNGHVIKGNGSASIFNVGNGGTLTIYDCQHDSATAIHTFSVDSSGTWILDSDGDKSVKGGVITNGGGNYGAIYITSGGKLELHNVNIIGNKAKNGAISNSNGTISIYDSQIMGNGYYIDSSNYSTRGGIFNASSNKLSTIKDTIISDNIASDGAGVSSTGLLKMENVKILNNHAMYSNYGGGGVYLGYMATTMIDCIIQHNTIEPKGESYGFGAGIYCNPNSLTIGGKMIVSDNTRNWSSDSSPNNVYLLNPRIILIDSSLDDVNSKIGISVVASSLNGSNVDPLYITENSVDSKYARIFKGDDEEAIGIVYDNGYVKAGKPYLISVKGGNTGGCTFSVVSRQGTYDETYSSVMDVAPETLVKVYLNDTEVRPLESLSYNDGEKDVEITNIIASYEPNSNPSFGRYNKIYSFRMPAANIVITAKHTTPNRIIFSDNGGRGTMSDKYTTDSTYLLPKCKFLPTGNKVFAGWSLSANGPIITENHIDISGNVTLYAIWKDHNEHNFITVELPNGIIKKSCGCGYYIIRYK